MRGPKSRNPRSTSGQQRINNRDGRKLTGSQFLIALSAVVLLCYFAVTTYIVVNDAKYNKNLLDDATIYEDAFKKIHPGNKDGDVQKVMSNDSGRAGNDKDEGIGKDEGDVQKKEVIHVNTSNAEADPEANTAKDAVDVDSKKQQSEETVNVSIPETKEEDTRNYQLKAFIEPINQDDWKIKPLPARKGTASSLTEQTFERIACSTLPEQWPTSEETAPTNKDPFLPWIRP